MKKFSIGDIVKCFGSEGQFLTYGLIKPVNLSKEISWDEDYYNVIFLKKYPEAPPTIEDIECFGGCAMREEELEFVKKWEIEL